VLTIRCTAGPPPAEVSAEMLAVLVRPAEPATEVAEPATEVAEPATEVAEPARAEPGGAGEAPVRWAQPLIPVPGLDLELAAFLADSEHKGAAGATRTLPRPLGTPRQVLLVGVGDGDAAGWRAAGAGLTRAAAKYERATVAFPAEITVDQVRALAEGALLADYRYRLGEPKPDRPQLAELVLVVPDPQACVAPLAAAQVVAEATRLARDLTNTPSEEKSPEWLAEQLVVAAAGTGAQATVWDPARLAAEGFGGLLAVGGGSARGPRLVRLDWQPERATRHVVLVGKGITFDTGGISIKPVDGMKLMRKDMGGAAAVTAATIAVARLGLPVRVTALAPLAENSVSGTAWRPGDVVRHYGGQTSEILNTDAEGRVVLADALAYGAGLAPDVLVDLATLTGANAVALGKRTGALYSDNDELAQALAAAADAAGEQVWRLPLVEDYLDKIRSDVADLANSGDGGAGSISAALYLREFTGGARGRWAHVDMSAPSWADGADAELSKGATGWGVRTLVRWLERVATD
jgi:leucyl aminopeptidase